MDPLEANLRWRDWASTPSLPKMGKVGINLTLCSRWRGQSLATSLLKMGRSSDPTPTLLEARRVSSSTLFLACLKYIGQALLLLKSFRSILFKGTNDRENIID